MSYVIGLDLGTSALKGLVVNKNGDVLAKASADYPLIHEKPGYSEQHPSDWIKATNKVLTQLNENVHDLQEKLVGLSISGQMHGLVTLDENHQVVRPAILWNDTRTTNACQIITETLGDTLVDITKNKALEGFTLPKIVWMQEEEPELWSKVKKLMLPKDYVTFYLTGEFATDRSDAAGTLLLDVEKGTWSTSILNTFKIDPAILPDLFDSIDPVGQIKAELIEKFGYKNAVTVAAGGADNACAAVGAGIVTEGIGMASVGTSGVFLSFENAAHSRYHGDLHLFNHAQPNAYYSMGVTLAAGHSLNWFKETFAKGESFDQLLAGIEEIEPGVSGLSFTPYIVGERTPYADSQIRGSFIGMDTAHTLKHFARAVLEGITFSLKDSQLLMQEVAGKTFSRIVSVGGGAKNSTWLQMQANIFNADILTLRTEQGPGMGAAMFAMVACEWYDDLQVCAQQCVTYNTTITPQAEIVAKYDVVYQSYRKIYAATKEICHATVK